MDDWDELTASEWEDMTPLFWSLLKSKLGKPTPVGPPEENENMIATTDISTLVTTIKNVSGGTLFFGFLPPHGKTLTANQTVSVFGSITEAVNRGDRFGNRHMIALQKALENNLIDILSTPAPVFYDQATRRARAMYVNNAVLKLMAPSWDHSVTLGEAYQSLPPIDDAAQEANANWGGF